MWAADPVTAIAHIISCMNCATLSITLTTSQAESEAHEYPLLGSVLLWKGKCHVWLKPLSTLQKQNYLRHFTIDIKFAKIDNVICQNLKALSKCLMLMNVGIRTEILFAAWIVLGNVLISLVKCKYLCPNILMSNFTMPSEFFVLIFQWCFQGSSCINQDFSQA